MVQIRNSQLLNNNLTGASFDNGLGFYDETKNYLATDVVSWQNNLYRALNNVTGTTEGDLTQSPDLVADWEEVVDDVAIYSVYPSTAQTFTNTRVTVNFNTERIPDSKFSLGLGEITFNQTGIYFVSVTALNNTSSGTSRSCSEVFLQLDTGSGFSDVATFLIGLYHRMLDNGENTGSMLIPLKVSKTDKIRVQTIRSSGSDTITTVVDGYAITIFSNSGIKGDKGNKGDTGADGDMAWEGTWSVGTYNENDVVEYQGSSYVCDTNGTTNNPGTPSAPNVGWDLLSQKGADGAGATLNVSDSGTTVPNSPFGTLNFTGDISATDGGSSIADINVTIPKNKYMIAVWAEENAALGSSTYEWAFGNGANTPNDGGITIHIPTGYSCAVTAMSLRLGGGTATVELLKNSTLQGSACNVAVSSGQGAVNNISSPLSLSNGDYINFRTTTASGTSGPCVVTAWLTYTEN